MRPFVAPENPMRRLVGGPESSKELGCHPATAKGELAEAERRREKAELERLYALAAPVLEISEAAEILVRAHLIACGYHRQTGEWRRVRGER